MEHGFQGVWVSVVVVPSLSFPIACGIFLGQGLNLRSFPALAGGFLTAGPPGKSYALFWMLYRYLTSCKVLSHWKDSDAGREWGQEEKGTTEDEMAGWHH